MLGGFVSSITIIGTVLIVDSCSSDSNESSDSDVSSDADESSDSDVSSDADESSVSLKFGASVGKKAPPISKEAR